MGKIKLKNIDKIYNNKVQAVFDFNIDIEDKEFIVFVGPSGCGKSTTLRMIAGLEDISAGQLYINDKLMNNVEPKDRDIAMVFQSYALYPHMTVYDNMSFGLKIKKVSKKEIDERVKEAARILELEEYLDRKPKELSGGQRQRVALGRAIVRNADVFLMDEPLSNLDAKLRVQMRSEIIKLHQNIGATTIYVTHDQTEAMTMASRIVVMKDGYIQQIGTPIEVYSNPANVFVASFIGAPATNFIESVYENGYFSIKDKKLKATDTQVNSLKSYEGREVILGIRPENISLNKDDYNNSEKIKVDVEVNELLGHEYIIHSKMADNCIIAKVDVEENIPLSGSLDLYMNMDKTYVFDKATTNRIV